VLKTKPAVEPEPGVPSKGYEPNATTRIGNPQRVSPAATTVSTPREPAPALHDSVALDPGFRLSLTGEPVWLRRMGTGNLNERGDDRPRT
jgi:hypothetical protein